MPELSCCTFGETASGAERTGRCRAVVQRKLGNLLVVFRIADDRVLGIDNRDRIANLHRLGLALHPENDVDPQCLPGDQFGGWNLEVGESLGLGGDRIVPGLQIHKFKRSVLVRCDRTTTVVIQISYRDGRARHNCLRAVMYDTDNASERGLSHRRTGTENDCNCDYCTQPAHLYSSALARTRDPFLPSIPKSPA